MALKKSELYSSLWASCDELRGGMDASQYKDYVLVLLFIKYISDKYAGQKFAPITIPKGATFADMVALKGKSDIGDQINKKIIGPIAKENKLSDLADFNSEKLGSGKDKVDTLTNLIAIFENPALDFSKNRADGDDILGDAYEYLMRHFATESGKSKGQFYTPAEVSRVVAQVIGISDAKVSADTTVYDPACGSGSLLLKVGDEAKIKPTLFGQEKDGATTALARMNMILHNNPTAMIGGAGKSSISNPIYLDDKGKLKQFDYVVANPPFSDKRWSSGLDPANDPYERFSGFGVPPAKQGDYAWLLHIVRSLKSTGKGACILPHGVLSRGNAEADIRKNLITNNGCYIKGVISLPANLFYGTGIPACIIVIDKKDASSRRGIFMIDAGQGFIKDGAKNRLREQDIHKIVDVFNNQIEIPKFSRLVPLEEIQKNDYNLNLPRYIDSQKIEDQQDIAGHLQGGIPKADIDALSTYWEVCPSLRKSLFKESRKGYFNLIVEKSQIKPTIFEHSEYKSFTSSVKAHFEAWKTKNSKILKKLDSGFHPKEELKKIAEDLLHQYEAKALIDAYDIYQHLMNYWFATMSDDLYLVSSDGWKATTSRILDKKGKDKGWSCDLIPKELIVTKYFAKEQAELAFSISDLEAVSLQKTEMEEEHGSDEGVLNGIGSKKEAEDSLPEVALSILQEENLAEYTKIQKLISHARTLNEKIEELSKRPIFTGDLFNKNKTIKVKALKERLERTKDRVLKDTLDYIVEVGVVEKAIKQQVEKLQDEYLKRLKNKADTETLKDLSILQSYIELCDKESALKKKVKELDAVIDKKAYDQYPKLKEVDVKELVVESKWMASLDKEIQGEIDRVSQQLAIRIKELAERYETALPELVKIASSFESKVSKYLEKMGFVWN